MRTFLIMLFLGALAGIVFGLRDRGWDSWNDDVLVYVGWLSFAGAVAGLLLGISLACWRRHGWNYGIVAFIVPLFLAFWGYLIGWAASTPRYPEQSLGTAWAAVGGLIGFGCGLLIVVIAGFTNWPTNSAASAHTGTTHSRPPKIRPPIDMRGIWEPHDDK